MDNNFLKKSTKTNIVIMSVIAGIAVIGLIMFSMLLPKQATIYVSAIAAIYVLLTLSIWNGILQIKVFNDYKSQRKSLCAEGIFNICITALIILSSFLFMFVQIPTIIIEEKLSSIDIRVFMGVFIIAFSIWKAVMTFIAIKEKRKNLWVEIVCALLWLALGIILLLTIKKPIDDVNGLLWAIFVVTLLLIAVLPLYNLMSYIFTRPDYLITEEAIKLLEQDNAERLVKRDNRRALLGLEPVGQNNANSAPQKETKADNGVEAKLEKLSNLKEKGLITEEEFEAKRKKLIDEL